jgi:HSP20 family molecular chaperone IbpA
MNHGVDPQGPKLSLLRQRSKREFFLKKGPNSKKFRQLPSTSNLDDIAECLEKGVLTVTVPKRLPASQPMATVEDIKSQTTKQQLENFYILIIFI